MPTLLVTVEQAGVDKYSQELARILPVRTIETRRYLSLPEAYRLAGLVRRERDLVHLPNQNFARYALFRREPFIVTVHDVIRFRFRFDPETLVEKALLRLDVHCIRRANHIIAASQHTRNGLVRYLHIPEDRVTLVYDGVDHTIFKPGSPRPLEEPYIIYVGSERPRKNLGRLFEAFAMLKRDFPGLKLVKAGTAGRSLSYRLDTVRKLEKLGIRQDVVFLGHVAENELARYYGSAVLLAYPSLHEGFGLPPLEAMASGCPVVASDNSSLPEVVGDAGILVDPTDTDGWVEAMRRVLTEGGLRDEMVGRGLERAKLFSWEKAARETLAVYEKASAR